MAKIEKLIEIDRTPDEVFNLVCSADNLHQWLPGVTQARLLQGNHSRWFLGQAEEADVEVVERRAPGLVRWRVSRGRETLSLSGALTETRNGDTILQISIDDDGSAAATSAHTLEQDLLGVTAAGNAQVTLAESLKRFKSIAEGTRAVDAGRQTATSAAAAPLDTQNRSTTTYTARPDSRAADIDAETTLVTSPPRVKRETIATPAFSAPVAAADDRRVERDGVATRKRGNGLLTLAAASLAAVLLVAALAWAFLSGRSDAARTGGAAARSGAIESASVTATPDASVAARPITSPSAASEADSGDRLNSAEPSDSANDSRAAAASAGTLRPARPIAPASDSATALRDSLGEWIAATNAADLGGQMRFYAPTLERYYLRRGFTRDAVRDDKAALARRARLRNVDTENPQITVAPDNVTATMRFRKNYSFDDSPTRNAVLQELRWRRTPEGWRIISERDLQVLR